jgi:hypothetical protein
MLGFRLIETFGPGKRRRRSEGNEGARAAAKRRFPTIWDASWKRRAFLFFSSRNSLKSPDSTKGIQGNARTFACFYLHLLASHSRFGCTRDLPAPAVCCWVRRDRGHGDRRELIAATGGKLYQLAAGARTHPSRRTRRRSFCLQLSPWMESGSQVFANLPKGRRKAAGDTSCKRRC